MKQRIWLITGISSGLGKALAQAVMASGDFVIGTFRNQSQADQFNNDYEGKGKAYYLDLSKIDTIEPKLSEIILNYGKIDVLVNNAGVGFIGAVEEASVKEVRDVFEVNFFAPLKLTQIILSYMRREKSGHIVQLSSHGGIKAFAGFGIYNASKFALEGFSEALQQEAEPLGIKVSLVEPGPFRTKFASKGLMEAATVIDDYSETAGNFRTMLKNVDGKQEGDPDKAAKAIIDLVNSEKPPLRLPLGKTALKTIGMKLESVKNDLEANREVAANSVFE
ncbi:MAG: oxidoreductase [Bacteroidota bacterium]